MTSATPLPRRDFGPAAGRAEGPKTGKGGSPGQCGECGHDVVVYPCADGSTVQLAKGWYPADEIPRQIWRHLSAEGVVRLGADLNEPGVVLIEHDAICPARPMPFCGALAHLWRSLQRPARRVLQGET